MPTTSPISRVIAFLKKVHAVRAFVFISLLNLLLTSASFLYITQSANAERARQVQQGRVVEDKLCASLSKLAALKPPGGNPDANPSRAYLQREHTALAQLGIDVGCSAAGRSR